MTEIVIPAHNVTFRPILTPKQRTIEAAINKINYGGMTTCVEQAHDICTKLYDAGMLTLPGEPK